MFEFIFLAVLIGMGGTALLDLWAQLLKRTLGLPTPPWHLVGRWFAGMRHGQFVHRNGIGNSPEVPNELKIGWSVHYGVGIIFAAALLMIWGVQWALVTIGAGWFILQPGMGVGVACNRAPNPPVARLQNVIGHVVFATGMYWAALLIG
jgi:hypothetical protein